MDVLKTDFGERIPSSDVKFFDGSDPKKMHNYYTLLYNKIVTEAITEIKGKKEALVFARSATVGSQCYPVHWGGDSSSNYPSMAETLRSGLSFGMSGFGYWSHDISGFEASATPDLYRRWTQFGLLSSHSRYHGSTTYKVPWLYGEKSVENTRRFTHLKLQLLPYLMVMSNEAHYHGVPILRSMVLEFPDDPGCEDLDMQYMLGDNLLVAPIFNEEGIATFYVPKADGKWISILNNKGYEGGKWYKEKFDDFSLPLLARPNSVIVAGKYHDQTMYDFSDCPTVNVFELEDGQISTIITDNYGEKIGTIVIEKKKDEIIAYSDRVKNFVLRIHYAEKSDQRIKTSNGRIIFKIKDFT